MANLISNPNLWTDNNGHKPPACWDGTKYDFSGLVLIELTSATPNNSDTVTFTLDITVPAPNPENNSALLMVSGGGGATLNSPLKPAGITQFTTGPLTSAGGPVSIIYNPQGLTDYEADFTITPPPKTAHTVPQSPVTIVYD